MISKNYLYIAAAGILWGTIGLFVSVLINAGLKPEQVAFCRLFFGSFILVLYSCIKMPEVLKIKRRGLMYALIIGLVTQTLFNISYFNAIKGIGIAASAVLLYTAPIFLTIFSNLFYKEKIQRKKVLSLALCFIGSFIAATGGNLHLESLNIPGILLGLFAAISYSLMPIISKSALQTTNAMSLTIYSFIFGCIFLIPLSKPWEIISYAGNIKILFLMIGLGLFPSALSYLFYMSGIIKGVELSIAGVISSLELVVSVAIAWLIMGESFSFMKFAGVCIMILSIFVASQNTRSYSEEKELGIDDLTV